MLEVDGASDPLIDPGEQRGRASRRASASFHDSMSCSARGRSQGIEVADDEVLEVAVVDLVPRPRRTPRR